MISRFTDLHPKLLPDLPGMIEMLPLLDDNIRAAAREFCVETEAWRERLSFNVVDVDDAYTTAYNAAVANGMSTDAAEISGDAAEDTALQYVLKPHYDADVIRPWKVWDDHDETGRTPLDVSWYAFDVATATLRLRNAIRTYSPVATTWATLTAYAAGVYAINSSVRYLCAIAHTAGTFADDLAAHKWIAMPNDLVVKVVLMPRVDSVELAAWFMEKWSVAIVAHTKALCMAMKDKRWSSPDRVSHFDGIYMDECAKAKRERFTEDLNQGLMIQTMPWVP